MAFVTGNANTMADLLLAIQNACTANGWTLSGNVLHKGTCYMEVKISTGGSSNGLILLEGGTGIDGSNNLTGRSNMNPSGLGNDISYTPASGTNFSQAFSFPLTYFIHVNTTPDEVYVVANYASTYYQHIGFGQSTMPGLNGSGNWYYGGNGLYKSCGYGGANTYGGYYYSSYTSGGGDYFTCEFGNAQGLDHNLDGTETWNVDCGNGYTGPQSQEWYDLWRRQPNAWNGESILIPVRSYAPRGSGFYSPALECAHSRHLNLSNLNDQQVITIGPDKWKIYPWHKRGTYFNYSTQSGDSGYTGVALRYDGP